MSNRVMIHASVERVVAEALAHGPDVDVDAAAMELSSTYQQSGIPIDEICDLVRQAVARRGQGALTG